MHTVALTRETGNGETVAKSSLQEALEYAARGWQVIPLHTPTSGGCSCRKIACKSAGKHPRTPTGLKEASTDEATIRAWWTQWPEANIGIATGADSGICILDVDGTDGQQSLRALEALEPLPRTLKALTGRTGPDGKRVGHHIYFNWPVGETLRNSAGIVGKGFDMRASGGYVVAPSSLHASGLRYEWRGDANVIADLPRWLLAIALKPSLEIVTVPADGIAEGQRNSTLSSVAGVMHKRGMKPNSILAALRQENLERCHPPLTEEEVSGIVTSIGHYSQGRGPRRDGRRADVLCLADVQAEEVAWLWEPYIPLKMITLLSGDPGVGKTFLALDLAASLTRGKAMLTGAETSPGNVLILTQENSPAHVLRPRFDALGGDASRFFILRGTLCDDGTPGNISLGDTEQLEDAITKHNVRLVIIDPLQSFLGSDVDAHRANQTRPILDGLIRLADKTGCAVLITRHLSKGIGGSALYRGMGSIDITGAARSELLVAAEPEQEGRVVMAHNKSNLGKFGSSLTYSINEAGKLNWHGESSFAANDLLLAPPTAEERSALDEAAEFLMEKLANGPQPAIDIQRKAKENGISIASLRRAQTRLNVSSGPQGFKGQWMLSLPTVAQNATHLLTPSP